MSRSTQFIGLTDKAEAYVKGLTPIDSGRAVLGMFDENIPLGAWIHPEGGIVHEVEQEVPWSSGPMIFTCLAWDFGNTYETPDSEQPSLDLKNTMFEWVHNPAVKDREYDPTTGEFWI